MKRIYLDNAAATPLDKRVIKAMAPYWSKVAGNPGAIHQEGVLAKNAVEASRKNIAELFGVHADEIFFTGSATESANLAILGTVLAWKNVHPNRTPHIVTSAIEHDAVRAPISKLGASGARVTVLPVSGEGVVDIKKLREVLCEDTVLVSVMYANNEIGTIQPIREIAHAIRKWKKEVRGVTRVGKPVGDERYPLFHADATQAINYCDIAIPRLGVDLLTMNGGKIYGPKGVGLLVALRSTPLAPLVVGGGHERGMRAGTENVPAIVGLAEALKITRGMGEGESGRLSVIQKKFIEELMKIPGLKINGALSPRLPNNINFSMKGVDHEFLVLALDAKGVAVATKSACNEEDAETSHVLIALKNTNNREQSESGIRLSLGRDSRVGDIKIFMTALRAINSTMIVG